MNAVTTAQMNTRLGQLEAAMEAELEQQYNAVMQAMNAQYAQKSALQAHVDNKNNPHEVKASQIPDLGNAALANIGTGASQVARGNHDHDARYPRFYTPLVQLSTLGPKTFPTINILIIDQLLNALSNLFADHEKTKLEVNKIRSVLIRSEVALAMAAPT